MSNAFKAAITRPRIRLALADAYGAHRSAVITFFSRFQITTFVRLRRSSSADAYWFLYSTKATHYTQRRITKL